MAHLSEDQNMMEAFRSGHDIHTATAAKIYHEELSDVTPAQRKKAKQANFGIIYGITTFGLAQRMGIDNKEARQLIDDYFRTFPKVGEYMETAKRMARAKGYAETLFKRRRYLQDINSKNATVRGFAERNAINAPIQGSEADIIKVAMIRIHKPKIIFADEPTAQLDSATSKNMMNIFHRIINDEGATVIMTTHDQNMMELADRVYTLDDGVISDIAVKAEEA